MTKGVIYYNSGDSCLIRLIVSLYSLRRVYDGNIVIFYPMRDVGDHNFSIGICKKLGEIFNCDVQRIKNLAPEGKNRVFLERTKYHTVTPFDISMSIDSDTVVMSPKIVDFLDFAEDYEYVVASFADWGTSSGMVSKRIKFWEEHYPELIEDALSFGPAINCGCFAFRKDAEIMGEWYNKAIKGRDSFICDETCMQILLPQYPHKILGSQYNTSCKHDININLPGYPVMVHFHGKKHCRMHNSGLPMNNADIWMYFFYQCITNGIFADLEMDVLEKHYGDKIFTQHLDQIKTFLDIGTL